MRARKIYITIILALLLSVTYISKSYAQQYGNSVKYVTKGTSKYKVIGNDTTLLTRNIFEEIASGRGKINISQTYAVKQAFLSYIGNNKTNKTSGYRIRIYFSNSQTARSASGQALARFNQLFPDIRAYRSYNNPYFTVTVGDFIDKTEAVRELENIKQSFPQAIIVKENIFN